MSLVSNAFLPVSIKRLIPRQQKELKRWSFDWMELLVQLKAENTYTFSEKSVNINVISLQRTEERKHQTLSSLRQQRISYEVFEAFDGLTGFRNKTLLKYAGKRRLKHFQALSGLSYEEVKALHDKVHEITDRSLLDSLHESLRFGCLLSHVMLWKKMLDAQVQEMVVLEDDVFLLPNFTSRLVAVLQSMPESWDLIHLNGCDKKFGPRYALGVTLSRGGLCTFGYAISTSGAKKLLLALEYSDKPIDHVLDEEVLAGHVFAFHTDPPLVLSIATLESTLAYYS